MGKKIKLILALFTILFLLAVTFTVVYIIVSNELKESLINTLETFDIYSVHLIDDLREIRLNVSFCLENNEKYAVVIDLIQARLYINNEYFGSLNPYGQITSFEVSTGEKCIISVIVRSASQKMIEIIKNENHVLILNGTIMGHASFFLFRTTYKRQFQIEKAIIIK